MALGALAAGLGGAALGGLLGSGSSPRAPSPPNAERLLRQQTRLNRINQFTPFGSLTFEGPDRTTARLELDPETQQLVDQLQGVAGQRAGQLPTGAFDPNIPSVGGTEAGTLGPFDQSTQAQQAMFQQAQSLLDPVFERREGNLRQTLANQGLPIGSEAFEGEFNRFDRERNRAFTEAALQSVQAGNQRQNQLFQQGLAGLGAEQGVRQQNLGELQTLLGAAQGAAPQLGSFFGPSAVDATGPAQLQQQGQLAQFNAQNQQRNAMMGGLFGLGGSVLGAAGAAGGFGNLF